MLWWQNGQEKLLEERKVWFGSWFRSTVHHSKHNMVAKCDVVGPMASPHPHIHTQQEIKKKSMNLKENKGGFGGRKGKGRMINYHIKHYLKVIFFKKKKRSRKRERDECCTYFFLFCSV